MSWLIVNFAIAGTIIPTLREKRVKSLGRLYNCSMKDTVAIPNTTSDLCSWLTMVDKSGLLGRFKSWIYQHTFLPRILWPLMIYDIKITTIMAMEKKSNSYQRRWWDLPRSISSIALYEPTNSLQLPFKGQMEEYMVTKMRGDDVLQLKGSQTSDSRYRSAHG